MRKTRQQGEKFEIFYLLLSDDDDDDDDLRVRQSSLDVLFLVCDPIRCCLPLLFKIHTEKRTDFAADLFTRL